MNLRASGDCGGPKIDDSDVPQARARIFKSAIRIDRRPTSILLSARKISSLSDQESESKYPCNRTRWREATLAGNWGAIRRRLAGRCCVQKENCPIRKLLNLIW